MAYDLKPLYDAMLRDDPSEVRMAIEQVHAHIGELELRQIPETVEVIASLFYIDTGDKPEWMPVIEEGVFTISDIGESSIPTLMWLLDETDTKANLMLARTLGRIGPPAFGALKDLYYKGRNAWQKSMALFALAKMHEAALMEVFPDVISSLDDSDRELRDTAARTAGRIISKFQPGQLPNDIINHAFENFLKHFNDNSAVVRSKCVRAVGKLVRFRYLDAEQLMISAEALEHLLGEGGGERDPLYVVRREAQIALGNITKLKADRAGTSV